MRNLFIFLLLLGVTRAAAQGPTFTEHLDKGGFTMAPNPANDLVRLLPDSAVHLHVLVYDAVGRNMLSTELRGPTVVDVSSLPAGAYMVSTANDRGTPLDVHRLIIAR